MATKKLMIVDCDCGVDDALALLLALAHKETWKLLAVTCCYGNCTVDDVCNNVRKVLQVCNETEIPVHRGCERPILKEHNLQTYHGGDGLGNVGHEYPHDRIKLADGHAVNALINFAKIYSEEDLHLVVLGPMTNIALAHRLDPEFTANLKSITFMGGNIYGVGNTTSAAEFNFGCDPEAANIVVSESKCSVTMIPWETTANHGMAWDSYEKWINVDTQVGHFVKKSSKNLAELCKIEEMAFVDCDFMAMAALISSTCIKSIQKYPVSVETAGNLTRGQAVIERIVPKDSKRLVLSIIKEFDDLKLDELRYHIIQ